MNDEETPKRTSLADLRSKFEGIAEVADERRARSDGRPSGKAPGPTTPSYSRRSQNSSGHSSRRTSPTRVPKIQIGQSTSETSATEPNPPLGESKEGIRWSAPPTSEQPRPSVLLQSESNTWRVTSPIVLSPSLSVPKHKFSIETEASADDASADASPSVASLRSRFDTGIKQTFGAPTPIEVKLSPSLRSLSRPQSPAVTTTPSTAPPSNGPAREQTSKTGDEQLSNQVQSQAGPTIQIFSPSPIPLTGTKPPPPSIPPKSRNGSPSPSLVNSSRSIGEPGSAPVPIPPRPNSTRMGSTGNVLTASPPVGTPPPLPGRSPKTESGENKPPRLPDRLKAAPASAAIFTSPSHPGLPPRRGSSATFRSDETLAPVGSHSRSPMAAHTSNEMSGDGYQPPPPPVRKTTPNPSPRLQSRVQKRASQDQNSSDPGDEEDDGEEPQGQKTTMSNFARRALEEYPDSSRAHRRAPEFVPRQYISTNNQHHIHAFAVCGYKLCLASHVLRIYDLSLGDAQPVITFDPKNIGLEFKGSAIKVAAVSFRPSSPGIEEGRYVWCGIHLGHLIEVDTVTGKATQVRAATSACAITHIFRYKEHMLSLDENGKMQVFGPFGKSAKEDSLTMLSPLRTIRIAERQTFARMLGNQVWTASGPATRSTTDPSVRGPTIRVYDPLGDSGENNGNGMTYTSEWTGAVTAAAVLSSDPSLVYLAHEGGYVSIFDRDSLACVSVFKISSSDVLSLEGVGDRLWAGYRTGMVHVYDVSTKPWTTTNTWLAHPEHPLLRIQVDKSSVEQTGRFAVWTWARDKLHAWDGLLSADWIETRLEDRVADYSSQRQLNVLICSWNIDSCKPSDLTGASENTKFLEECIGSGHRPDIIIFGFQEVIDLNDRKLAAKTMLFGRKDKHDGRGSADNVSHAYARWQERLSSAVRQYTGTQYNMLDTESLVGLMTVVFVKGDLKSRVSDASITTMKRGMGGKYGNKGAIVARCVVDDSSMCFVNVHLAAGQSQRVSRNADIAAILDDKSVLPPATSPLAFINGGDGTRIGDHETIFLSGDLNYRVDQRRDNVIPRVEAEDFAYLLEFDQLRKEMKNNSMFRLRAFREAPIHFAPTYKYTPNSKEYDQSQKQRTPAWCDRVLWKTRTDEYVDCIEYRRYEAMVSDHRPVSAHFNLTIKEIDPDRYAKVRKQVADEWFQQEGALIEDIISRLAATA
ncbi:hypothetical protein QFC21_000472 [Naganishia friedmannii]|uniref:Uncharacterized protein n=1 Tax=Naganishia friedmannii TaxID=89922 RepID=A0ACC2WD49_9TREE|nr:hypothetical protein QFC21_000472 [Naganishia friedmannii]